MNNKGFTLIELIATIALLAIISVISIVSISNALEESKIKNCENLLSSIKSSAKEYVSDNRYKLKSCTSDVQLNCVNKDNNKINITAKTLVNNNYLTGQIKDPFTDNEIDEDKILIKLTLNKDYSAREAEVFYNSNKVDCSKKVW